MAASTLLVGNLAVYPTGSGSSTVQSVGGNSNFPTPASGFTAFASLTAANPTYAPSTTMWVVGYIDGSGHMHLFQANNASTPTIGYPTLQQITQIFQVDSAGATKAGGYKVFLLPGANSPDQSSPLEVFLDQEAILIYSGSTQFG